MVLWKFDLLINIKRQHLPVARFSEITSKWQISDKGLFWWHFIFPWVSMTENLTQYDHTANMCRKHWCSCKENCSIDVFPLLCIWVAYFTILKFKLLIKKWMGLIIHWYQLARRRLRRLLRHTWEFILKHRLHGQYIFEEPQLCIFLTEHCLSHTVNIHFPLHSLEVFMIAIQEVQQLPSALNLILTTPLGNFCNSF